MQPVACCRIPIEEAVAAVALCNQHQFTSTCTVSKIAFAFQLYKAFTISLYFTHQYMNPEAVQGGDGGTGLVPQFETWI